MEERTEDRRSRRSRRMLKQGLLELMEEKRFPDISVRDITDRMDLNRGTFYLHYPDTFALLRSVEDDVLAEAWEVLNANRPERLEGSLRKLFGPVLDYIVEKRSLFHLLMSNDSSRFVSRLQELIRRYGEELAQERFQNAGTVQMEYLMSFIAYGLIGVILEWFGSGMGLSREGLVELADKMVTGAAENLLACSA